MKIIQVNMLKKGEHFRIYPDDEKIYRRGDFVFKENKYACIRIGKAGGLRNCWLGQNWYTGCLYMGKNKKEWV